MKSDLEMTKNIIRRSNEYKAVQQRKKKIITRSVVSFGCICLAAMLCFGVWHRGIFPQKGSKPKEETAYPDHEITTPSNAEVKNPSTPENHQQSGEAPVNNEHVLTPDINPSIDPDLNDSSATSGSSRISVAVSDDYVAFVNKQKKLKLYDLATGKIIETGKKAKGVTTAGHYIFYYTDDGVYEYSNDQKVCASGYSCVAYDGSKILFADASNHLYLWNGGKAVTYHQLVGKNALFFNYNLKNGTIYASCHDLNDDRYFVISLSNGILTTIDATDYSLVNDKIYTLKNGNIYNGNSVIVDDGTITSINATDYGIYALKYMDDTHFKLVCYDLNGNITDEIQNVSSVKEYSDTIGIKFNVENQSYAAAITKDGMKKYAVDSLFLDVHCNEQCLVAPAINSFDIVVFHSGKLLTVSG